jgi:uncharacterized protein YjbI with pentapeptide repeats
MKYKVKIHHDKIFRKVIWSLFYEEERVIETQQTAEVTFFNSDGSLKEVVTYGYKSPDEILEAIKNSDDLDLNCCYIGDISFENCELQSISAEETFFEDANFRNTTFTGKTSFEDATFEKYAKFGRAVFKADVSFKRATFNNISSFYGATFIGMSDFDRTTFEGRFVISCAKFTEEARAC